jgi:hypothetical protein
MCWLCTNIFFSASGAGAEFRLKKLDFRYRRTAEIEPPLANDFRNTLNLTFVLSQHGGFDGEADV